MKFALLSNRLNHPKQVSRFGSPSLRRISCCNSDDRLIVDVPYISYQFCRDVGRLTAVLH